MLLDGCIQPPGKMFYHRMISYAKPYQTVSDLVVALDGDWLTLNAISRDLKGNTGHCMINFHFDILWTAKVRFSGKGGHRWHEVFI